MLPLPKIVKFYRKKKLKTKKDTKNKIFVTILFLMIEYSKEGRPM